MSSRLRIIVSGLIAQHPTLGGVTWDYLRYVLGRMRREAAEVWLAMSSILVGAIFAHSAEVPLPLITDVQEEPASSSLSRSFAQPTRSFSLFPFEYGSESRSTYRHLEKLLKKSGLRRDARVEVGRTETWARMRIGPLRIKASLLESVKDKNKDAYLPEAAKTLGRLTATFPLVGGSFLSLSYGRGASGVTSRLQSSASGRWVLGSAALSRNPEFGSSEEAFEGSFNYQGHASELLFSSTYSSARNELFDRRETVSLYHYVSGSVRPTEWLTISPSFGFWQDTYRWSGVRAESLWAAPTVTYGPFFDVFKLKAYAYYDWGRSSDASWDDRNIDVALGLVWMPKRFSLGNSALLFQVGHSDYLDRIYASGSTKGFFGGVHIAVHPF